MFFGAPAASAAPNWQAKPCWFQVPNDAGDVRCGVVRVPLERGRPGRAIDISVVLLKAKTPKFADPVVFVSGGPGTSSVRNPARWFGDPLRAERDLVLFDARGSWGSGEFCPKLAEEVAAIYAADLSLSAQTAAEVDAARRCAADAREDGVKLQDFTTSAIADDLDDIRRALGVRKWNVLAVSYGSAVALAAASLHPDGFRSLVLDSVSPPDPDWRARTGENYDFALARLFEACRAQDACFRENPNLRADYFAALQDLEHSPLKSPEGDFVLNPQDFIMLVHRLLYGPETIVLAPMVIEQVHARNASILPRIAELVKGGVVSHAYGAHWAIDCQGRGVGAHVDRHAAEFPLTAEYMAVCPALGLVNSDPRAQAVKGIAIPTLIIAGQFDPITPVPVSLSTRKYFKNSKFVEINGFGHTPTGASSCAKQVMRDFFTTPDGELNTDCASKGALKFSPSLSALPAPAPPKTNP